MLMYACMLKFSMYVSCVFDFIVLLPIGVIKNIYMQFVQLDRSLTTWLKVGIQLTSALLIHPRHLTVNHHGLLIKLMNRLIPTELLMLLESWLSSCYSCVKWVNVWSCMFSLEFGVRQGFVLSPFLFSIYVDVFGCRAWCWWYFRLFQRPICFFRLASWWQNECCMFLAWDFVFLLLSASRCYWTEWNGNHSMLSFLPLLQ